MANRVDTMNRGDNGASLGTPSDGLGAYSYLGTSCAGGIFHDTNGPFGFFSGGTGQTTMLLDASTAEATVSLKLRSIGGQSYIAARFKSDNTGLMVGITTTSLTLYSSDGVNLTQIGTAYTGGTIAVLDTISVACASNNITVSQNGTTRITTTSAVNQTTGTLYGMGTFAGGSNWWFSDLAATGNAPASGIATAVCTSAGVALYLDGTNGSTAASGATTYQWCRSQTSNFTASGTGGSGTSINGATSSTYSDTSGAVGALWFYKCLVNGSLATAQVPGEKYRAAVAVGFLGDSVYERTPTNGEPPPTLFQKFAEDAGGLQVSTVTNCGASGSATADWLPSASAWSASGATLGGVSTTGTSSNLITLAEVQLNSIGATDCFVRLGANDVNGSVTPSTYASNLSTIITHLFAHVGTLQRVHLNYPTYGVSSWDAAKMATTQQYESQIDGLVNGTTIRAGDKTLWDYSATHGDFRQDDIHPSAKGAQVMAAAEARVLFNALYPVAAGGGSTPSPRNPLRSGVISAN